MAAGKKRSTTDKQTYKVVKALIKSGHITRLKDIFSHARYADVHRASGISYGPLHKKMNGVVALEVDELIKLAEVFEVNPHLLLDLYMADRNYTPLEVYEKPDAE